MTYSNHPFDNYAGYQNFGAGQSHDDILAGAGCGFYNFEDPRPGRSGRVYPDRYYLDTRENRIKGIDFRDREGNFACSYCGEDYDELLKQNHEDIKQKQKEKYEKVNLRQGAKRERLPARIGDRGITYDDRELKRSLSLDLKDVELKSQNSNPELYDKYNGLINPISGNAMTCTAIYTNKVDCRNSTEEVQYVELRDMKSGDTYHYIADRNKSVDQQIVEDMNCQQQCQTEETTNTQVKAINQGVKRS